MGIEPPLSTIAAGNDAASTPVGVRSRFRRLFRLGEAAALKLAASRGSPALATAIQAICGIGHVLCQTRPSRTVSPAR